MKKVFSFILLITLVLSFSACVDDASDNTISYYNAEAFENALNDGTKVKGKLVQFCVEEYAPDSILGINCHAGEHLNFIFDDELNVKAGDTIVVRITKEPSKVFLIGSWEVPCKLIEVVTEKQEDNIDKEPSTAPSTAPSTVPSTTPSTTPSTVSPTAPTNMAGAPDDWTKLLENHYEEVKKQFENSGFTNIICVAHEIDYNENYVFEGSVINIAIGENGEICTFSKGEQFAKDIKIRIDYRVKPAKSQYFIFGKYEQDGNTSNGPESIEWIILDEKDGKMLLISRYILDYKDFNDTTLARGTSWGDSTLRKWLNYDFYNTAFSMAEKSKVISARVQDYKAENVLGEVTSDNVFILSRQEAFRYFTSNSARATTSTPYARTHKSYVTDSYWLINSYSSDLYKYLVNADGINDNCPRVNESEGIRPVIWVYE